MRVPATLVNISEKYLPINRAMQEAEKRAKAPNPDADVIRERALKTMRIMKNGISSDNQLVNGDITSASTWALHAYQKVAAPFIRAFDKQLARIKSICKFDFTIHNWKLDKILGGEKKAKARDLKQLQSRIAHLEEVSEAINAQLKNEGVIELINMNFRKSVLGEKAATKPKFRIIDKACLRIYENKRAIEVMVENLKTKEAKLQRILMSQASKNSEKTVFSKAMDLIKNLFN